MHKHNNSLAEMQSFLAVYKKLDWADKEKYLMESIQDCDDCELDCDMNCQFCLCFFCGYCCCDATSEEVPLSDVIRLLE